MFQGIFPSIDQDHVLTAKCGAVQPRTFKEAEDRVSQIILTLPSDELALLYEMLYNMGYRKDACRPKIAALRKRLG